MTVSTKNVPGVGTVLVNRKGQTLYLLTSEKGGKVTCMASNGCTQAWPETDLPSGTTAAKAGTGAQSSLLGTVTAKATAAHSNSSSSSSSGSGGSGGYGY